jgi:hypothetical protein
MTAEADVLLTAPLRNSTASRFWKIETWAKMRERISYIVHEIQEGSGVNLDLVRLATEQIAEVASGGYRRLTH